MNIYVDFDDCLCETARHFSTLVAECFDKFVPYEDIKYFNLKDAFSLTDEQYVKLMAEGHRPEVLLSYDETAGAVNAINNWIDEGHDVNIITGRPFSSYEPSRKWLDEHDLKRAKLYCLNKYARDGFINKNDFSLEIEDYKKMHFDLAVEDSPAAFKFFDHLPDLQVVVFDRPWNSYCDLPGDNYHRCNDWEAVAKFSDTLKV